MIATQDIAAKAADFLERLDFKGQTPFEFVGPQELTLIETTQILGRAIGKPDLKYVQLPYEEVEKGMIASGMKPKTVGLMIEMYRAFNEGRCSPIQKLTPEHLGSTTQEQFAAKFAQAFKK